MFAIRSAFAAIAILGLGGCGKSASPGPAGEAESACARDLTPRDVADLLGPAEVSVRLSPTNAETCSFAGPGRATVVIGVRAGEEVEPFWKLAVDLNHDAMAPMPGVGDAAVRTLDSSEVLIRKGRLSCQVDVIGMQTVLARPAIHGDRQVLAGRMARVCAKVFAARRA